MPVSGYWMVETGNCAMIAEWCPSDA